MHDFDYYIINTPELLKRLITYASHVESPDICYDLETNSAIEVTAEIWGFGLSYTENKAFYVVWRNKDGSRVWTEAQEKQIISWLKNELTTKKVFGHNLLFDVLVTENNFKFSFVANISDDTILLKHTINEERPHGLKESAVLYLGPWADKAQEKLAESVKANGGRWTKDQKDMYLADTNILAEYCCYDVILCRLLRDKLKPTLKEEKLEELYETEVLPLYKYVTIDCKRQGFTVDVSHFEKLNKDITEDIIKLEDSIMEDLSPLVSSFEAELLDKEYPVKAGGNFPKLFAEVYNIPLPFNKKTGAITLAAKELQKLHTTTSNTLHKEFYNWLITKEVSTTILSKKEEVQKALFFKNTDRRFIFNLHSGDHLGKLLYDILGIKPFSFTDSGKPSTDAEVVDELISKYANKYKWLNLLTDYRKLNKIKSTYIEGILDRQIDGVLYTSLLQHGTTSGRYSSTNPNLQNLPSMKDEDSPLSELVKKYVNSIRKGLVAPEGYKIVAADFSQLEPCAFASVSGDKKLQEVFHKGWDLYSKIAIDIENLTGVSADKKAPNYLKNLMPEKRSKSKVIALAIPYGSEEAQVSNLLGVDFTEAGKIIRDYLNAYPDLKKYMNTCKYQAKNYGFVRNQFGRIRHLPRARELYKQYGENLLDSRWAKTRGLGRERRELKNLLNNSTNFPIQSLAAHIVNRAMIAIHKEFKNQGIDGNIILSIHDEIVTKVREDHVEKASKIIKYCMENTTKIAVPLQAEPVVADNLGDAK